jgi:septal ring factor EnvC (AmiA/AmiB activator)|tara:strand:- start:42 stop:356 length:315 start_codon:yes stop_codon:yes gene_type:complete
MATKISEDTNVLLDLKTIGIIIGGVLMVAGTYFTLSSSVEKNSEDIEAINQNTINPVEFDYKDKLIRSTIEKIESDVSTVKDDVNEIKESLSKIDERLYEIRKN